MDVEPEIQRRRFSPALLFWLGSLVTIFVTNYLENVLDRFDAYLPGLGLVEFSAWLVFIAITLYGFALVSRWILSKLFWTVGRRLLLSYVLIGVLPFVLFAVLLTAILYVVAAVASQASFRTERQSSLSYLERLNSEYAARGTRPREEGLELYDTSDATGKQLPAWLRDTTYSGFALREKTPYLISARQYPGDRTVVLALPMDERWARRFEERAGGMVIATKIAEKEREGITIREDGDFDEFASRGFNLGRVFFFDITEEGGLIRWEDGEPDPRKRLFTAISNPISNLLQFY
ncbi:MAG TPA: hypothetical protein VE010_10400, partial [Thermoanaerobaculia bacterium]|nr:hypothetical protein [Thermoanaerobaculia bacterium]